MNYLNAIRSLGGDAVSAFVSIVAPDAHALARDRKDDAGFIQLLGVYEADGEMRSLRFLVVAPGNAEPELALFDARGRALDISTRVISYGPSFQAQADSGATACVIAALVPVGAPLCFVAAEGAGIMRITALDILLFERKRDAVMCNPGIDGRYQAWIAAHEVPCDARSKRSELTVNPLMSVVTPVFNTPLRYLRELIESMEAQTYPHWEHVLVNASPDNEEVAACLDALRDDRFVVVTLEENRGIPGNTLAGIKASSGEYISFLDHDDLISPFALEEYVRAINANPDADLLFCDEDTLSEDGRVRSAPIFKPSFQSDLFTSWNYLLHMLTVSRRAFDKIVPPGDDVNGAQDYDMGLKIWSVMDAAVRVPGIQYHWRQHEGSVNGGAARAKPYVVEASVRALDRHYRSAGIPATATPHEILWLLKTDYAPMDAKCVSIVINSRDEDLTDRLVKSLEGQRRSLVQETIVVSDGALNEAIERARGTIIVLVDDSVVFMDAFDAIGRMADALDARDDLGIVAAKSQTPEALNLHAGLCVKSDGAIGYLNQGFVQHMGGGYNGCAECQCDYSAVDLSCAAFRKADFMAAGRLSTELASKLGQAVDFSFKMRALGKRVMVDPDARVTGLASLEQLLLGYSHLSDDPAELGRLWARWDDAYRVDVLDNSNYTLDNSYFNLA